MKWEEEQTYVRHRLVFQPMPMATNVRLGPISGRWPQSFRPIDERREIALTHAKLIESIAGEGQREPITARFIWWVGARKRGWWPKLKLVTRVREGELSLLRRQPLIYEGNHRLGVARMLSWAFVLVEPRVWIYTDTDTPLAPGVVDGIAKEVRTEMRPYAPLSKIFYPRPERERPDHRPHTADMQGFAPFFGEDSETAKRWIERSEGRIKADWPPELLSR